LHFILMQTERDYFESRLRMVVEEEEEEKGGSELTKPYCFSRKRKARLNMMMMEEEEEVSSPSLTAFVENARPD